MIGQNTIKGRKIRNEVIRLEAEIRKLKTANAILQEDKEELRRQKDNLEGQLRRIREPIRDQIAVIKDDYAKQHIETMNLLRNYKAEVSGLEIKNSRLKDALWMVGLIGVVAGLMLAPILAQI